MSLCLCVSCSIAGLSIPNQPNSELEITDGVSLKSLVNSSVGTRTPEIEEEQNTKGLYFIR